MKSKTLKLRAAQNCVSPKYNQRLNPTVETRHMRSKIALVLCCIFASLSGRAIGQPSVKKVEILSVWGGLGIPPHRETSIEIFRTPSGKYQEANEAPVESSLIADLVSALQSSPNNKVDLGDLGIDQSWLAANYAVAEQRNDELQGHEHTSEKQRHLYKRTFKSPAELAPIVANLFSEGRHTDDNPRVRITVTFEDGSVVEAQSNSQHEFMLPWSIQRGNGRVDAFNRQISKAVVAIMPTDTTNRERLNGDGFPEVLGAAVMGAIQNDWDLMGVAEKCPQALAALRRRYKVRTGAISGDYAIEYGREWHNDQPQETNLQTVVTAPEFPDRFDETMVLEMTGERVIGIDQFLKQADGFEKLSLSVSWLNEYRAAHRGVSVHLYYVHTASLAERGLKILRADMRAIGRGALAEQVLAVRNRVALLVIDENSGRTFTKSHWIVLPDHRMVLWRFSGPPSALVPFKGRECSSDDPEAVGGCVGRVKLSDGRWQD